MDKKISNMKKTDIQNEIPNAEIHCSGDHEGGFFCAIWKRVKLFGKDKKKDIQLFHRFVQMQFNSDKYDLLLKARGNNTNKGLILLIKNYRKKSNPICAFQKTIGGITKYEIFIVRNKPPTGFETIKTIT